MISRSVIEVNSSSARRLYIAVLEPLYDEIRTLAETFGQTWYDGDIHPGYDFALDVHATYHIHEVASYLRRVAKQSLDEYQGTIDSGDNN